MRIAIDAMGGDDAPDIVIAGAIDALSMLDKDDELYLVGPEELITSKLAGFNYDSSKIKIVNASEVIGMDEPPVDALRKKKDSSIGVMAKLASRGKVDAVISAGNTGACVAACQLRMRNLAGVNRPGISVIMPTFKGPVAVCDVGANVACKPMNLYQYAVMSSLFIHDMYKIDRPRVGLMSIGEEDTKGNDITKKTRELLLADDRINFIGNIEGRDVFNGVCDVVVCEGFVGNVILKLTEGLVSGLFEALKQEVKKSLLLLALVPLLKGVMKNFYKKYDYHEYGGALLLGVNGTSVICHGSSKARTIKNAIFAAKQFNELHINDKIVEHLAGSTTGTNDE